MSLDEDNMNPSEDTDTDETEKDETEKMDDEEETAS